MAVIIVKRLNKSFKRTFSHTYAIRDETCKVLHTYWYLKNRNICYNMFGVECSDICMNFMIVRKGSISIVSCDVRQQYLFESYWM